MLEKIKKEMYNMKNEEKAKISSKFFKTGPGEYGEGDKFLGISVPETRKIAKEYVSVDFNELKILLNSDIHEFRLLAVLILVEKYQTSSNKEGVVKFYLDNTEKVNNWDLVDLSAYKILGDYIKDRDRKIIYKLAKSKNLWEKRISIISTFAFILNNQFDDTLEISKILLNDKHDLIQKAVGWMLREVGKRDIKVEETFLRKYYKKMPRTMLLYAIERFPKKQREYYLTK